MDTSPDRVEKREIKMKKILETERLFLREMTPDDFESLYNVLADTNIMQHYPYVFDDARVQSWIERNMKRYSDDGFGFGRCALRARAR